VVSRREKKKKYRLETSEDETRDWSHVTSRFEFGEIYYTAIQVLERGERDWQQPGEGGPGAEKRKKSSTYFWLDGDSS
jgi:hypothetical protein